MGTYLPPDQLTFARAQNGDNVVVAERNWDKAEDYGGETALSKTNQPLYEEID